jgi:hypothetical protein
MNWQGLCELARELPEVVVGTWYGTPGLKVRGKGFVRLKEDGESVVFLLDDVDDQELLLADAPEIYFITEHYRGYASVLARLAKLPVREARIRLAQAWRQKASPALQRQFAETCSPRRRR